MTAVRRRAGNAILPRGTLGLGPAAPRGAHAAGPGARGAALAGRAAGPARLSRAWMAAAARAAAGAPARILAGTGQMRTRWRIPAGPAGWRAYAFPPPFVRLGAAGRGNLRRV